jgi:RNA polymerase sigma-70 factor (ECF subfamily)
VSAIVSVRRPAVALDFDALYRDARDDVYAYAATLVRDPATAEDIVAAAFERAFRRRRSFDARRGSPRAWLFGIARNAALDELRRAGRRRADGPAPGELAAPGPDPQEAAEAAEREAAVRRALAALEPRDREIIALRFHAGLGTAELASVLNLSATNAATRLHRAMTKLRKAMETT